MQRSSKVILITLIILITLTIIGTLLSSLDLLYHQAARTAPVVTEESVIPTAVTSEIVILHNTSVQVSRFDLTVTLTNHKKINDTAINTTVSLSPADTGTESIHFSAIGEVVQTEHYRFKIVNATSQSVQLLILRLAAVE